jgi:cation diffusion facilitator family transporter
MSSMFIYIVLMAIAAVIFTGGLSLLISGHNTRPGIITFFGGIVSILYNVIMYRFGQCSGKRTRSPALLANSFENRADAISSFAVCVGILLAITVHPVCDPIAAMVVGVIIFVNCVTEMRKAMAGLMDKSLSAHVVRRIRSCAQARKGVLGVSFVRSRSIGQGYWVDLGVEVRSGTSASRAEEIADEVRNDLMARSRHFERVEVYVEAEPSS